MKIMTSVLVGACLLSLTGCSNQVHRTDEVAPTAADENISHEIIITKDAPVFKLKNVEITEGDSFNNSDCIEELAEGAKYSVIGSVDNNKAGTYKLRYTVTDDYGDFASQTATVTVNSKPEPEPEPVASAPVYQQPTYNYTPTYNDYSYTDTSGGGASGSSSADATGGQSSVGGMSWDACVAEVARRNASDPSRTHSCVQIVGTNSYYVLDY